MATRMDSAFIAKRLIWSLVKHDISTRYLGSVFGSIWIFILPLVNLVIMWFAFQFGLRVGEQSGYPFILWLVTGLFPWLFFSDAVLSSANAIVEKSYLVKKIVFDIELLPLVKILASSVLFVFLVGVMCLMFIVYGYWPTFYWLQVPYYMFSLVCLVLSISWLNSAVIIFYRDLGQILSIALQVFFWVTPIFWSSDILPKEYKIITFLNPVNYIISGFRDIFIYQKWFWELPGQTMYFWFFVILFSFSSLVVFKRLKPHFADVL